MTSGSTRTSWLILFIDIFIDKTGDIIAIIATFPGNA